MEGIKGGAVGERRCRGVSDVARGDWDRGVGDRKQKWCLYEGCFQTVNGYVICM